MKKKKKTISYQKHKEGKRNIVGMKVIGIDPAKEKHQMTVIDQVLGGLNCQLQEETLQKTFQIIYYLNTIQLVRELSWDAVKGT